MSWMSGRGGTRRQPPQMLLGWVALALFLAAVVLALLKITRPGLVCVAVGGIVSVVALVMEYRQRRQVDQAVARGEDVVFPETGTFGARRSRQTHTKF